MVKELYDAGGSKLTTLGLGAFLMVGAFLGGQLLPKAPAVGYASLGVGVCLIGFGLYSVYVQELRPLARAQATLQSNKEMIDTIQLVAVDLSDLALELQTLAVKHADDVNRAIAFVRPILQNIPVLGPSADNAVKGIETLSEAITTTAKKAKQVLLDLKEALEKSDPTRLKAYVTDLEKYTQEIQQILNQSGGLARSVSEK